MTTLAVVAQKGGVAKTTTVANLAAAYGVFGRRVLAVDLDPQFDLTRAFGQAPSEAPATVLDVLMGEIEVGRRSLRSLLASISSRAIATSNGLS